MDLDLKNEVRRKFRTLRRDFVRNQPGRCKTQLLQSLKTNFGISASAYVGCYKALADEADPSGFVDETLKKYKWCYPVVTGESLRFFYPSEKTPWKVNSFGIWEPVPEDSEFVEVEKMDAILVPALAFDKKGQRLGSGKGFYDRILKNYRGEKIGIAFEVQISELALPQENHDIRMDLLVTELGLHRVNERNRKHG